MPSPFPNLPPEQRGSVRVLDHQSSVLQDNALGDPSRRDLHVYLPPGYAESEVAYPSIMVLPGYTGTGEKLLARGFTDVSLATRIDALIADGCPPFIAVMPDCMTRLGGSQYVDSVGLGAYASYLTDEIRLVVDDTFRTTGRWGVTGHSSGGFGAIGAGLAIGLAALGAALGQGRQGAAALEGIARNPQAAGKIQTPMIIALAFTEALALYGFVIGIMIIGTI